MIISASRRTDIPAFYSEWFINRIREKYVFVQNPFSHKYSKVDLSPEQVDVIVFWTKNPRPLLKYLDEINNRGYQYYFTFTLNAYPKLLELSVPPFEEVIAAFKALSTRIGDDKVIWRFDPIVISSITPEDFIINLFERIAKQLHGHTRRVVISFVDFYKKFTDKMKKLEEEKGIKFFDVSEDLEWINRISSRLSEIAHQYSLRIFSCAEKHDLSNCGIEYGKCIDDEFIKEVFGKSLNLKKDQSQRKYCGCVESKDIGQYDSCIHSCLYCYANKNKTLAHRNFSSHNPHDSSLLSDVEFT